MTEVELLGSITDEELKYLAVDLLDFHAIGGFKEGAPILDLLQTIEIEFGMNGEEAIHSLNYMLTMEIIERYSEH